MDDIADFRLTDDAMTHMGLSDADKLAIYTIIAGVLHLGNISFEESHDDSTGFNYAVLFPSLLPILGVILSNNFTVVFVLYIKENMSNCPFFCLGI